MSWLRYISIYSAWYYHRDYEIKLYYTSDVDNQSLPERNDLCGENYFDRLKELGIIIEEYEILQNPERTKRGWKYVAPAQTCDILQWHKLYEEGGIFCDSDIIFLRPINEELLTHDILTCFKRYYTVGFWGAKPDTEMMLDFYSNAFFTFDEDNYQTAGVTNIQSVTKQKLSSLSGHKLKDLVMSYPDLSIFNLSFDSFYRWDYNNLDKVYESFEAIKDNQIGIHWYGGHVDSKKWIKLLTQDNYKSFNSTLCNAIRRIT